MSSAVKHPKTQLDWYEEVCQRLDVLKESAQKYADEGDVLPPCSLYETVKVAIKDLRQLASFPNLTTPDVWLGPNGEIGLTWETEGSDLDLIFWDSGFMARLTQNEVQKVLEPSMVSVELAKFAA